MHNFVYPCNIFTELSSLCVLCCCSEACGNESAKAASDASVALEFSSSFFNPLFHYWRIEEIRHSGKAIVMKLCIEKYDED